MNEPEDIDALAGEYVLGTLTSEEHAALSDRRLHDPLLDAAIADWEARFGPLAELADPVAPPPGLLGSIEADLFGAGSAGAPPREEDGSATILTLRRQVRRWRSTAAVAAALAAAVTLTFGLREAGLLLPPAPAEPSRFVAWLQKDATSPAFVVSVDTSSREISIRPVAATPARGKSYELWLVNKAFPAPRSLGIVAEDQRPTERQLAAYSPELIKDSVIAVTLEPEGGSPSGQATGPILFTGKLVELSH